MRMLECMQLNYNYFLHFISALIKLRKIIIIHLHNKNYNSFTLKL